LLNKIIKTDSHPMYILIRIMVGAVFVSEGIQKFMWPMDRGAGRFERIGIPLHDIMGPFVGGVEIIAGVLILIGLMTRPAAFFLINVMLVAIFTTKIPILLGSEFMGFSLRELKHYGFFSMAHEIRNDWSMLMGSIFLILTGGGRWSFDLAIWKKQGGESELKRE